MAFNAYLGKSQQWLESQLALAQADLAAGKTVTRANSDVIGVQNELGLSTTERIRLLLAALNKLDPETYPADQVSPATQTRAVLNAS